MPANPRGVYAITRTDRAVAAVERVERLRPDVPIATLFVRAMEAYADELQRAVQEREERRGKRAAKEG